MSFWMMALVLMVPSVLIVLWPVLRPGGVKLDRATSAMEIFRDQLAEVSRDETRGIISGADARAAETEIKRRMIAADRSTEKTGDAQSGGWLLLLVAMIVPVGAAVMYNWIGAPETPSVPFAQRAQEREDATQLNTLIATLRERLTSEPDGGETRGWELLARTLANQGRNTEAVQAWAQIVERSDATSATWSQYAESLIAAEGGIVTPAAENAIDMALSLDPNNPAGTFYKAVMLDQAGQTVDARQMLLDRIGREQVYGEWMPFFLQTANRWGAGFGLDPVVLPEFASTPRGPSQDDIAAAADMSPEDRDAMVGQMVAGLAARLKDTPDDLQGWLQLSRAYMVLGERDKAKSALTSAMKAAKDLPQDDPQRVQIQQALDSLGG